MTQIATTIEQSKRLIKAGLDPDSCDMWWVTIQPMKQNGNSLELIPDGEPYSMLQLCKGEHIALASFDETPAWSLSRLIDIMGRNVPIAGLVTSEDVIEQYVTYIVTYLKSGNINEKYIVK